MDVKPQPKPRIVVGFVAFGGEEMDAFLEGVVRQGFGEHQAREGRDQQRSKQERNFAQHEQQGASSKNLKLTNANFMHANGRKSPRQIGQPGAQQLQQRGEQRGGIAEMVAQK